MPWNLRPGGLLRCWKLGAPINIEDPQAESYSQPNWEAALRTWEVNSTVLSSTILIPQTARNVLSQASFLREIHSIVCGLGEDHASDDCATVFIN